MQWMTPDAIAQVSRGFCETIGSNTRLAKLPGQNNVFLVRDSPALLFVPFAHESHKTIISRYILIYGP